MLVQWTSKANRDPGAFLFLFCCPYLARWPVCAEQLPSLSQDGCMSHADDPSKGRKSVAHGLYLLKEQRNHSQELPNRLCFTSSRSEHYYMLISKPVIGKGTEITLVGLSKFEPDQGFVDGKNGELVSYASSVACHISLSNGVARQVD